MDRPTDNSKDHKTALDDIAEAKTLKFVNAAMFEAVSDLYRNFETYKARCEMRKNIIVRGTRPRGKKPDIKQQFGSHVAHYRSLLKLSQSELAAKTGMSDGFVKLIEVGRRFPRLENLKTLADALGCTMSELFNFDY